VGDTLLMKTIFLPVDFPVASPSILQQAVTLAERFQAELVMVHVATPESIASGVPADDSSLANWNLFDEILQKAGNTIDQSLRTKLQKLVVRSLVLRGDPAKQIVREAQAEDADLIMMSSHGDTFGEFLLGSVTTNVLGRKECPVWTGAHTEDQTAKEFSIHNILCAVDLGPHSQVAASWAGKLAAEFGAHLTLSNVTQSMAIFSPGGSWANPKWQQDLVDDASHGLAELQKSLGIKADLLVGSGDVPKVLSQMATQVKADLLVLDCYPSSGNLRIHAYAIISTISIPVLSV
jgi:nucleotide-binding universal stress UspA family protein